jgi:hypothetical protein
MPNSSLPNSLFTIKASAANKKRYGKGLKEVKNKTTKEEERSGARKEQERSGRSEK